MAMGILFTAISRLPSKHGDASYLGEGSHLPSGTTGFWQFKGWSQTITVPTVKPDLQDSSTLF